LNILLISSYSFSEPFHGGQVRVSNIANFYKKIGCKVQSIGILSSDDYLLEKGFISRPSIKELSKVIENYSNFEDYIVGYIAARQKKYFDLLFSKILFKPDIIQLEHPWFIDFALKIKSKFFNNSKIVYSSHNNEYHLKKKLIDSFLSDALRSIRSIEIKALSKADYVISVSENNKKYNDKFSTSPSIIIQNGTNEINFKKKDIPKAFLKLTGKYALFFGSSYKPNLDGFFYYLTDYFGSIPPDKYLVIAGDIYYEILKDERFKKLQFIHNKTIILGRVNRNILNFLIKSSHSILLPLHTGDGTSLKTAEAIYSKKYIIGTPVSLRGFESFNKSSQILLSRSPVDFKKNLLESFRLKPIKLSEKEIIIRNNLLWKNCLKPLSKKIIYEKK